MHILSILLPLLQNYLATPNLPLSHQMAYHMTVSPQLFHNYITTISEKSHHYITTIFPLFHHYFRTASTKSQYYLTNISELSHQYLFLHIPSSLVTQLFHLEMKLNILGNVIFRSQLTVSHAKKNCWGCCLRR